MATWVPAVPAPPTSLPATHLIIASHLLEFSLFQLCPFDSMDLEYNLHKDQHREGI